MCPFPALHFDITKMLLASWTEEQVLHAGHKKCMRTAIILSPDVFISVEWTVDDILQSSREKKNGYKKIFFLVQSEASSLKYANHPGKREGNKQAKPILSKLPGSSETRARGLWLWGTLGGVDRVSGCSWRLRICCAGTLDSGFHGCTHIHGGCLLSCSIPWILNCKTTNDHNEPQNWMINWLTLINGKMEHTFSCSMPITVPGM